MKSSVRKVVIPVAGLGTRALPFSKEVPKEMLPVIDTPTVHFIVEEVLSAGIEQVIFVTSKGKSMLEDYFDPSPALESWLEKRGKDALLDKIRAIGKMVEVVAVRQKEPAGLGHAVLSTRSVVGNEPFAVCLGDEIFPTWWDSTAEAPPLKKLVQSSGELGASVVGVVQVAREETTSYGIVDFGGQEPGAGPAKVTRTVEKPKPENAPSRFAIIGRYVFDPEIFDALENVRPGVGGEIQLTDGMDTLAKAGKLYALPVTGRRYDMGNHFGFVQAQVDAALRRPDLAEKLRRYLKTL